MRRGFVISCALLLISCSSAAPVAPPAPVEASVINRDAKLRIFFGHQSVGGNILEGVRAVAGTHVPVREVKVDDPPPATDTPGVLSAFVGKNEEPLTKLADYEKAMDTLDGHVDVALFKFCYIDFSPTTDPEALFTEYQKTMARLSAKHPSITFVHVTVPLTVVQGGLKGWAKKRLGQAPWGEKENVRRNAFNEKLRATYAQARVFDLAALEAKKADGTVETTTVDGVKTPALRPDFTDDGAHLNPAAQKHVATALLGFLATVSPARP